MLTIINVTKIKVLGGVSSGIVVSEKRTEKVYNCKEIATRIG